MFADVAAKWTTTMTQTQWAGRTLVAGSAQMPGGLDGT